MILETRNLVKAFGGIKATDDLNLSVKPNELHAIIGPNGAGKTTLMAQLTGTLRPDSGSIHFKGDDITALPAHRRAALGLARSFQITSLILDISVADNIALAVQARHGSSFRFIRPARHIPELRDGAQALLDRVGLGDKADRMTRALSHGEHRRMEIAMALASNADVMLLDEPMAGLGTEESLRMIELLSDIKGRHAILLVEHDMDAVFALADRISVLVYGRIIATGTPEDIRSNADVQAAYLGEDV